MFESEERFPLDGEQSQEELSFLRHRMKNTILRGLMKLTQQGMFTVNSNLVYSLEWPSTLPDEGIQACVRFMEAVNAKKWKN